MRISCPHGQKCPLHSDAARERRTQSLRSSGRAHRPHIPRHEHAYAGNGVSSTDTGTCGRRRDARTTRQIHQCVPPADVTEVHGVDSASTVFHANPRNVGLASEAGSDISNDTLNYVLG